MNGNIQLLWYLWIIKIHSISNTVWVKKNLIPSRLIWITKVSVFFYSPCRGPYNFHSMTFYGFSNFFPVLWLSTISPQSWTVDHHDYPFIQNSHIPYDKFPVKLSCFYNLHLNFRTLFRNCLQHRTGGEGVMKVFLLYIFVIMRGNSGAS
jgi:hypothetical protein